MAIEEKEFSGKIFDGEILSKLYVFIKPYQKTFFFLIFITLLSGLLAPIRPFIVQLAIDKYMFGSNGDMLLLMTLALIGLVLTQALIDYGTSFISALIGQNIIRDVRAKLFDHLLKFRLSYFDRTPIGRLITRNISDIETMSDIFTEGLADIASSILQLIFIMGIMFYMNWKLTLVSLSVIPLLLISTYIFKEKVKKSFNDVRTAVANLNTFVQEHITGMNIVQIFNSEEREFEKFKEINKQHRNANLRSVFYYSVYFPVAEVLSAAGIGLLVWYGARGVVNEQVTFGTLVAFIMYIQMFFRPIREIADKFNTLQMGIVGSARVMKLLDTVSELPKNGSFKPEIFVGNIQFENVSFAYIDENYVLKNITFEVKKGETVALVGATGAGKSSIINLLNRFYEINSGKIVVDGRNLQDYDLGYLRNQIGVVLQDVFLFSDSIKNNISLGNQAITIAQIRNAAAEIGALEFIEKLPGGFEYQVMERGATLSVGQRQLISFVRAMVYNPKILVLDEATSSVDSQTEELIQNALLKMLEGRTSIVIAHRLSTIQHANKIIVIDKGEIVEQGSHDELLSKDGHYANLNRMQFQIVA